MSFVLRRAVINTGFTIYLTITLALCVKIDLGTHKVMHSVLALKLGVTLTPLHALLAA
jgi:predicted aspartyl protease